MSSLHRLSFWMMLICAMFACGHVVAQETPKRIYIANDDHTDFMWTADADTYANVFVEMLDHHLRLAEETKNNPAPYRNRFNADGSYWMWNYEHRKSDAEFAKLIQAIKDGTISVPLNPLVSCYGGQPTEAVLRGLYYAGRIERKHDLRFELATAMENQTLPLGLASLFAGSGAKYSWRGVCGCATKLPKEQLAKRDREIYWYTGHDGQRILMKWYSLVGSIGGYWEAGYPSAAINWVDSDPGFLKRYIDPQSNDPYKAIGVFGFGGDDLARKTGITPPPTVPGVPGLQKVISSPYCDHFYIIAEQESNASRQVIVSNEADFFHDFESHYGQTLDSHCVTYGNEWDLYSASMSETSARVRRAVEKLRAAELLSTLVSLKYPDFMRRHESARDRAFIDLGLFWEHNWTADGPISRQQRASWQEQVASNIEYYVNSVYGEAIIRLGGMIPRPDGAKRFFVLNPLGWPRTDYADFAYNGSANVHVIDLASGNEVPFQLVKLSGAPHLRILASEVPSAGYKVFEIATGPGRQSSLTDAAAKMHNNVLDNGKIKLTIAKDGAIQSLIDLASGREFVAEIDGLLVNDFAANSNDGEPIKVENVGPVSVTIRARSEAGLAHTTSITVYRDSKRIDIRNELTENFSNVRHWAFGFSIDNPQVHTEEVGTVNLNRLKSAGGDYADTHARYDYLTLNHFADISGDGFGVTLSNTDLAFAKLGRSTLTTLDTTTPQIQVLAGGQVDGSSLGIRGQNGASYFLQRFALQPHDGYDQAQAMKFSLEHQNPFVTGEIISKGGDQYTEKEFSLLTVSNPNVVLWALKPSESGITDGIVARVWNQSMQAAATTIAVDGGVSGVQRVTHIETPIEDIEPVADAAELSIHPHRLETFLLHLKSSP